MNLFLDARKKSLAASAGGGKPAPDPAAQARDAARNMFAIKSAPAQTPRLRKLLPALAVAALLGAGIHYAGYGEHPGADRAAPRPFTLPPIATAAAAMAAPETTPHQSRPEPPPRAERNIAAPPPLEPAREREPPGAEHARRLPDGGPVRIERRENASLDALLRDAYSAYRGGNLGEARQLYLAAAREDARNVDALLGLASIAQQHGDAPAAGRYWSRVLELDPRNAAANAGMSSLSADDGNHENRLQALLREQDNAAALHFALGNLYAGQSRWNEAQQAFFRARALQPDSAEFAYNLAVSLDHLGQAGPAAQHYRRALQLDPSRSAGLDHGRILQRIAELAH